MCGGSPLSPLCFHGQTICKTTMRDLWNELQHDRHRTYYVNTYECSCNHCCSGQAISIIYSECVCVRARARASSYTACKAHTPYYIVICNLHFSKFSHKRYDFRKPVTEYKTFVLIFTTNFVSHISHSTRNSARLSP